MFYRLGHRHSDSVINQHNDEALLYSDRDRTRQVETDSTAAVAMC
jgi:hypothetical protein